MVLITILIQLIFISHVDERDEVKTGYDLTRPDDVLVLPDTLREISGLTDIDYTTFACIQDENGVLFIYDSHENKIIKQYTFNMDGDYEGITRVDHTMYILRSDGDLFEIRDYDSPDFKLIVHETGIPARDNEGLCYDKSRNRLLIGSKGKIQKGSEYKDKRVIYAFDLETKRLDAKPAFEFSLEKMKQFAKNNNLDVPMKRKKKNGAHTAEPHIKHKTSAIAIHPFNQKLYLLSAADHLFFVFEMDGTLEHIEKLDSKIFNKAEGLTFIENGDMLIANEGQEGKPTLLKFRYQN